MDLPQCSIEPGLPLVKKVKRIAQRAKTLEEQVVKMEADHKIQIAELEAHAPGTPPTVKEERVEALKVVSTQMQCQLEEVQKMLTQAMATWTELQELPDIIAIQNQVKAAKETLEVAKAEMKTLEGLAKMRKISESNKLQQEVQRLKEKENAVIKMVQPWSDDLADIATWVEEKMKEFTTTKEEVDNTGEGAITQDLLNTTQQCIAEMDADIVKLK